MRVAVFILTTLVGTALLIGGILLIVVTAPSHPGAVIFVPTVALTIFVYGPLMLGSLSAYWGADSPASRRSFRTSLIVVGGLELVAAIAVVVYSVLEPAPLWLPVVMIGTGVVLPFAAIAIGRAVLRHEVSTRPIQADWSPITRRDIMRKCVKIAVTFVAALPVAAVGLLALNFGTGRSISTFGRILPLALDFASIAAAFTCIMVTLPLNRQLRDAVGRDLGTIRKVAKVVLRRKSIPLDDREQVAAAKYATLISITLSFTLTYVTLLYVGIAIQQVVSLGAGTGDLPYYTLAFLVIVQVVLFPLQVLRIVRARRYADAHADLLPS